MKVSAKQKQRTSDAVSSSVELGSSVWGSVVRCGDGGVGAAADGE